MTAVKTAPLAKQEALNVIYDFFKQFQSWISAAKAPIQSEVEKNLSPHFKITINGQIAGKTSADYVSRIKELQNKYSRVEISKPLEEPIYSGNEIAIYYRLDLTPKAGGPVKQVYILALGTIEDKHITRWTQVTHQKGTGDWDKHV